MGFRDFFAPVAGVCALLVASAALADGGSFRIRHAEAIGITGAAMRSDTTSSKAGARTLSFVAYGRQFDLELEPNSRLLNAVDMEQRRALTGYGIYRGRLRSVAGSWVRIVRAGDVLTGAIWDGADLYSIGPASTLQPFLDQPLQIASGALAVYRLADTAGLDDGATCLLAQTVGSAQKGVAPLTSYKNLIGELQMSAAQLADRQIEVAFLGDGEFSSLHPDPQAAALTRINIVDGIFSEQVGVIIAAPVLRFFPTAGSDPFVATSPGGMLEELSRYRTSTQDVRDRGLAHLLTGKNVDDNIIGAAVLGALCEVEAGVGFAESVHPDLMSALITAHELGHNFNAPHDDEPGSPCAHVQTATLMSPFFNFNQQFSQCGLHQMYAEMETAACIVPGNAADAQITTSGLVTPAVGQPFDVPFNVASVGTADLPSARVTVQPPSVLTFISATVAGGTCGSNAGVITCELGAIAAGTSRPGNLRLSTQLPGSTFITMNVTAVGDHRDANDTATAVVVMGESSDLAVGVSPSTIVAQTDESFAFTVTVASLRTDLSNVRVTLPGSGLTFEDVQALGATCTGADGFVCTFPLLATGESRQIVVRARRALAGDFSYIIQAVSSTSAAGGSLRMIFTAAADATVVPAMERRDAAVGESFDVIFTVASVGRQPVNGVVARMPIPPSFVVESATIGGAPCTVDPTEVLCSVATLASRTARRMLVRGHGTAETSGFSVRVSAANDANSANDLAQITIFIRPLVDLMIHHPSVVLNAVEGRKFSTSVSLQNRGVRAAREVTVRAELPASFEILAVALHGVPSAQCQMSGNTATCAIASLPAETGGVMAVEVRAGPAGVYSATLFTVAAPEDETPANNSQLAQIFVVQDIDVSVTGPDGFVGGIVGDPVEVPLTLRTGPRPVNDIRLTIRGVSGMQLEGVIPQLACTLAGTALTCPVGNLPAQAEMAIALRLRFDSPAAFSTHAQVIASGDTDFGNDQAQLNFAVDHPADVALTLPRTSINAVAGQDFPVELRLSALGTNAARNVRTRLTLPAGMGVGGVTHFCSAQGGVLECSFGHIQPGGSSTLGATLLAQTAGSYTLDASVLATNDTNPHNDRGQITVTVAAASTPPPQPPLAPPSSGGGGGGGTVGWALLLALLLSIATKQNYRLNMARRPLSA